jgi:hypothetical protein
MAPSRPSKLRLGPSSQKTMDSEVATLDKLKQVLET